MCEANFQYNLGKCVPFGTGNRLGYCATAAGCLSLILVWMFQIIQYKFICWAVILKKCKYMKRDKAYKGKSWDVKNQLVKLIDQVIFPPPPQSPNTHCYTGWGTLVSLTHDWGWNLNENTGCWVAFKDKGSDSQTPGCWILGYGMSHLMWGRSLALRIRLRDTG